LFNDIIINLLLFLYYSISNSLNLKDKQNFLMYDILIRDIILLVKLFLILLNK